MSSDPIEAVRERLRDYAEGLAAPVTLHAEDVAELTALIRDALASLSAPKRHERPKGNTPIDKLLAEYEADGCDHSNMVWVRAAAQRYVETMEDSQVRCLLHVLATAPPRPEATWKVLEIGARGSAYDPPNTRRAFTYEHQPGNVLASRLGGAANAAVSTPAGDSIDRGLSLLKALQEEGFGVFQIEPSSAATQQASAPVGVEDVDIPEPEGLEKVVREAVSAWDECRSPLAAQEAMHRIANDLRVNEAARALAQTQGNKT